MQIVLEKEKFASTVLQVQKNAEAKHEMDRKLDNGPLDSYLAVMQRDFELKSELEERRRRYEASREEARRKKARGEASRSAEEERKIAEVAEKEAKGAADKMPKENLRKSAANAKTGIMGQKKDSAATFPNIQLSTSAANVPKKVQAAVKAAENALELEKRRLQEYKELEDRNQSVTLTSEKEFRSKEREIVRQIKQITGSVGAVRSKAIELLKIFNDPTYPQSFTVALFAKKVPAVMDCLLAEFHKACIYTVPKHITYSKSAFGTKEAYFKAIGYRHENGKLETTEHYLERLGSLMKIYGAVVQTNPHGVQNMHGLEEGWAWLARLLNNLLANVYPAVALEAFLRFLQALDRSDPKINAVIARLQDYIESNAFLKKPEGWEPKGCLLSSNFVPGPDLQ
ncbi:hypothetical protein Cgig2_029313 [Carnegiea gigantea]|uniref:mRNA export factor GLE1 n=1 Tax=Carnegiea gigantea TaxID=171969 RepID=A0A9Q1KS85_9CARY|nr:hypothetical protein Cgig2_029313 [Carnegiea gigantea]